MHASVPTWAASQILYAGTSDREIEAAFANLSQAPGARILVAGDPFFFSRRALIVTLAARHAIPASIQARIMPNRWADQLRERTSRTYVEPASTRAAILKGEKPADLPVLQPTKFDMVINLSTAKALGLDVPPTLLALADEVIE